MNGMRGLICMVLALASAAAVAAGGSAGDYPNRPIRLLVPHPAGGGNDILARWLAMKMQAQGGHTVIVDNRGGGNTIIATDITAKAAADGYTMILTSSTHSVVPGFYPKLPFDPIRDFSAIALIATASPIMVVHPTVPATNVKELIAWIKSKPEGVNFGSSGVSGSGHLAMELFKNRTGLNLTHIPYKGMAPVLTDIVGGNVVLMFGNLAPTLPHVKAGRLRVLATAGAKRSPVLPDLPTVAESGIAGFEVSPYFGILGPAKIPAAIVAKMNAEVGRIYAEADSKERLSALGFDPASLTPEQFIAMIKADMEKWAVVIKQNGITKN
jgi:tripartite-type tricarboxylate transporter receptor subunit TctC